jgi:hypothetical protein
MIKVFEIILCMYLKTISPDVPQCGNFRVQISPRGFFPPISLLNISVYRLQPRLFIDSLPYLKKKTKRTIKSYGSAARLDQAQHCVTGNCTFVY